MAPKDEPLDERKKQNQRVFIVKENVLLKSRDDESPVMCKMRHPKTEKAAIFLFSPSTREICEVLSFKDKCSSWIIDQTIQQDGSILITTPVDPLFMVLPYMVNATEKSGKFMTLDQILMDEEYPECNRLCTACSLHQLEHIADTKGDDEFQVYRYNSDRTTSWLRCKVEKISSKLQETGQHVASGAQASMFVKSKSEMQQKEDYTRYAYGMVKDYLPQSVSNKLREYLGIPEEEEIKPGEQPAKKVKLENVKPDEDYSQQSNGQVKMKVGKTTVAQKKLEMVDKSGMKNISSFFSPKPKK